MKHTDNRLLCSIGLFGLMWLLMCGGSLITFLRVLGQEKTHANLLQQRNRSLSQEIHLRDVQLQEAKRQVALTKHELKQVQDQLSTVRLQADDPHCIAEQALFWAVRHNDAPTVTALLKAGVNPNCLDNQDSDAQTALVVAVETGYGEGLDYSGPAPRNVLPVVSALLAHGADVNRKCADGGTSPWTVARRHGSDALFQLLETAGAKE